MGLLQWVQDYWLDFLQSVGIISSFIFAAITLRNNSKTKKVSNLLKITEQHRDIWSRLYERPELSRVLETELDLETNPVTRNEELFMIFIILHLSALQETMKQGLIVSPDGLKKDIRWFLSLPIPNAVWKKVKPLQDQDFVAFVEICIKR